MSFLLDPFINRLQLWKFDQLNQHVNYNLVMDNKLIPACFNFDQIRLWHLSDLYLDPYFKTRQYQNKRNVKNRNLLNRNINIIIIIRFLIYTCWKGATNNYLSNRVVVWPSSVTGPHAKIYFTTNIQFSPNKDNG